MVKHAMANVQLGRSDRLEKLIFRESVSCAVPSPVHHATTTILCLGQSLSSLLHLRISISATCALSPKPTPSSC